MRHGFDPKTSVFDTAKSTAQQDVFDNADGTTSVKDYQRPVNYRTAGGTWAKINTHLVRQASSRFVEAASTAGPSFAASASDPSLLSYSFGAGESVSFGLVGAADVAPTVSGSEAQYSNVLPQVNLDLEALAYGSKESVILQSASAQRSFTYTMQLTGLTAMLASDGSVQFVDASGAVAGDVPRGVMTDANVSLASQQAPTSYGVTYALTSVNGTPALTMTLDDAWLSDPARAFPVTVDPTVYGSPNINASSGTYALNQGLNNNSADTVLKVGTCDVGVDANCGITVKSRAFLSFPNIGSSYQNDLIDSASLNLLDVWSESCSAIAFNVAPVTQSWTASTPVQYQGYNLGSSIGSAALSPGSACTTPGGSGTPMQVQLSTSTFNGWTGGTGTNYGLGIYAADTDGTWKQFASLNTANPPYLLLTYQANTTPSVTSMNPPSGEAMQTLTPELTASGWDPDAFPGKSLQYEFKVFDNSTGTPVQVADSGTLTAASPTSPEAWTVPAKVLKWSGSFYWQVRVSDQIGWGVWTSPSYFNLAVAQPNITSHIGGTNGGRGYDPLTGNYTAQATDANLPSLGPALTIQRTYNSLDPRVGQAFGSGWSTVVDSQAAVDSDGSGNVVITMANGQQVRFGQNGDGSFSAPSGMFATLTAAQSSAPTGSYCPSAASGYCLLDKSGTTYAFTFGGTTGPWQLSRVVDAQGRASIFGYDSTGLLHTITSCVSSCATSSTVTSRQLTLTWTSAAALGHGAAFSHVTRVATNPLSGSDASTDLVWTYGYFGDELTSVCDPTEQPGCSQVTSYGYLSGSQFPAAVTDAGPQAYWRLGDAAGSTNASDQVLANEGTDAGTASNVGFGTLSDVPGPSASTGAGPLNTGETPGAFNGTSSDVQLQKSLVTGQSYLTVGLWFKTSSAGLLFTEQNQPMGSSTTPSHATASLYVGTDNKLHGAWYTGNYSQAVSTASVTDNAWHYVVLAAAGNTQTLYLDGAPAGTAVSGQINNLDQTYAYVGAGYSSGQWPSEPAAGYNYFHGQIAEAAFYAHALGGTTIAEQYAAAAHASALLTSITKPSTAVQAAVQYDVPNDRVIKVTDANGGGWQPQAPTVSGSSSVYAGAVLGSSPEGYWRLQGNGDSGGIAPTGGGTANVANVANNEVTQHATSVYGGGCSPTGVCTLPGVLTSDPDGDGVFNNATLGVSGSSPFSDTTGAQFDGSSSNVQLPGNLMPASGPAAIELWFNTTTNTGMLFSDQASVIGTTTGAMIANLYVGSDRKLYGGFYTTSGKISMVSPATVTDGAWHHVVLSTDGADQALYLDGAQIGSSSTTSPINLNSQPYVYVGAGNTGDNWPALPSLSTAHFNGFISDVSVYRHALSGQDAAGHYAALKSSAGLTPVLAVLVSDPLAHSLRTTFDPMQGGRLLSSTDANGGTTRYGYDSGGFLNTVTDPLGDVTTTGHDVRGNEISKTVCQDQATYQCSTSYITYWPDDQSATLSPDPRDDLRTSTRDGRSTSASDPTYMTQYAYDSNGNITAVTDPLGRRTVSTYSTGSETPLAVTLAASGAATCSTSAGSGTIPAGLVLTKTTPGAATTSYAYYADGDLAQTTSPLGARTIYVYDGLGRVLFRTECSDTYPNGTVTGFQYDGDNRTASETDPATSDAVTGIPHQKVTQTWYTPDGQVDHTIVSDAGGAATPDKARTTLYTYYPSGLVKTMTDPSGAQTQYSYDAEGNKASQQDPNGNTWQYGYNGTGQRTSSVLTNYTGSASGVCQPSASHLVKESRAYDLAGRLASVTDAMCRQTTYTYFDNGLTASATRVDPNKTDGSGVTETKTYDGAGHLLSDAKGNGSGTTLNSYDPAGQSVLTRVLAGADSSGNPQYKNAQSSYDADGHVSSVLRWRDGVSGVEQTDYTHDAEGDVTSQTVHDSNAAQSASANLAGAWPLNDGATTTGKDGSGGNHPASVSGWTGWSGDAPSGHSGSLWVDGVSGQAATAAVPVDTAKDYSVSTWVKLDHTPASSQTVVTVTGSHTNAFYLDYSAPTGGWTMQTTTVDSSSPGRPAVAQTSAPAVAVWTHLVGTYNAETKTLALYVNGSLIGTTSVSAAWTAGGQVLIGTSGGNFAGKIADVQLWNRTLAQSDVNQLYNHLSLGSQGLAGSWALNDGVSSQGADASGAGHPAAVAGGVSWNASRGGAAVLDGSSGYLAASGLALNTNNSYTVAAWVNMNQPSSYATVLSQGGANMSAFYLQYSYAFNTWAFAVPTSDASGTTQARAYSTNVTPAWNTWTFLAGVYDAVKKTATLYVGGTAVSTVPVTGTFNAQGPLTIGAVRTTSGALSNQVSGAVSGVGVYGTVLTQGQIQTLVNGGSLTAPTTVIKTTWTYDQRGIKTSMTSPMGNAQGASAGSYTAYYTSDQLGRGTEEQQPSIKTYVGGVASTGTVAVITWTGYDTFGDKLETQDPDGNITVTAYDQDGQPTGSTLPSYTQPGVGGTTLLVSTKIDYNPDGTVLDRIDPAGNKTSYTYDQLGDVLTQTNPPISVNGTSTAGVLQYTYDQDGERGQFTDPTGAVTQYQYNYLGQKTTQTAVVRQPPNASAQDPTTYTYDTLGNPSSVTSPTGVKTQTVYDPAGEKTSSIDGAGNTTTYSHDVDGRLTQTVNPDGSSTSIIYDLAGNLTWHGDYDHTGALARFQSASYYLDGSLYQASDYMGFVTQFSYDQDGNLAGQVEPTATGTTITTSYGYDAAGHRTQETLGNGNTTVYTYNRWGLPESKIVPAAGSYTAPANRTFTTVYDQDANPYIQTQPGGVSVSNTFDALGNLTQQSGAGSAATSSTRTLGYDLDGRVISAATQDGSGNSLTSDTFTYDDRGALLKTLGSSGSSSFTYNAAGQMASRIDASSTNPASYSYDTAGRLSTVAEPLTGATATYGYNTLDQVSSINYTTSGTAADTHTFGYDNLHRLQSDTLTTAAKAQVAAIDYTYNNDDQEIEQDTWGIGTTSATTEVKNTYGYDQAGRLTSWNNGTTIAYYGYDADGNRTCNTTNAAGCIPANSTYQYNALDQLIGDGTHTYTYAANGTLAGIITTATSATEAFSFDAYQQMATDAATSYTYDALGRTLTAGAVTLAYSGQGNQIASDNNVTLFSRDPAGGVLGTKFTSSGSSTLAWTDAHQNLVARFTPAGSGLTAWSVYDPMGNKAATSGTQISLGYQSGYSTGGKVNMATRWYSPATGQFDSADTLTNTPNPASVNANPYTYANDNPLTATDPSGHCIWDGCVIEGTALVIGTTAAAAWITQQSWYKNSVQSLWDDMFSSDTSVSSDASSSTSSVASYDGVVGDTWWGDFAGQADNWWTDDLLNQTVGCAATKTCAITCPPTCTHRPPPPPPPPPLWLTTKNPNSATCKATAGIVCSTTVGQANLPSIAGGKAFANTLAASATGLATALFCTYLRSCAPGDQSENNCAALGDPTNDAGNIQYAPMQAYGTLPGECRPTEVTGYYTSSSQLPSDRSDAGVDPPGWGDWTDSYCEQSARLHLLASQLGGDGCNPRNIVWGLQQLPNNTLMKSLENKTAKAIKNGQTVSVWVFANYPGPTAPVPTSFTFIATGSGGLNLDCNLPNGIDTSKPDRYKTQWGKCQ